MLWFLCSLYWQHTFLCACNRPNSWWCLTTWRLDCSGLYPDSLMCPSCPQSPCFASCLIVASACWLCSSTCRQSYLLKPTTKGVCVQSLLPFSELLKVASQFGSKTLVVVSHLQGGSMGSLRVGAEHRSSPASNGPAVDAGWWSEWRRAAAAWTDPVHAAAACSSSQPAAGQLPSAARDHTAPHSKWLTLKSFGTV